MHLQIIVIYLSSNMNTDVVNVPDALQCPICGQAGDNIVRYRMGAAAWAWCCGLFWTTYFFWLIPVCSNSCKDTELLCNRCGAIKLVIPGKCCWFIFETWSPSICHLKPQWSRKQINNNPHRWVRWVLFFNKRLLFLYELSKGDIDRLVNESILWSFML
jgi:hypothetical protein